MMTTDGHENSSAVHFSRTMRHIVHLALNKCLNRRQHHVGATAKGIGRHF